MGIDINDLPPKARAQVLQKLQQEQRKKLAPPPKKPTGQGSKLEEEYYRAFIWPRELTGEIERVEQHKRFELLPKSEYCGLALPAAHYTPDFLIYCKDGTVEVVEVKHEAIRKNQRDYIYRRRLFIDLFARPNGWKFTEYIRKDEDNGRNRKGV